MSPLGFFILQPSRIKDRPALLAALAQQIGADPAKVSAALDRPGLPPDQFLPVADVRGDKFTQVQPVLEPIPGVFFQRKTGRVTVSGGSDTIRTDGGGAAASARRALAICA